MDNDVPVKGYILFSEKLELSNIMNPIISLKNSITSSSENNYLKEIEECVKKAEKIIKDKNTDNSKKKKQLSFEFKSEEDKYLKVKSEFNNYCLKIKSTLKSAETNGWFSKSFKLSYPEGKETLKILDNTLKAMDEFMRLHENIVIIKKELTKSEFDLCSSQSQVDTMTFAKRKLNRLIAEFKVNNGPLSSSFGKTTNFSHFGHYDFGTCSLYVYKFVSSKSPYNLRPLCQRRMPWIDYKSRIKTLVLYEGITSIDNNAFSGCKSLTSVTFPQTLVSIGDGAFSECSSLTSLSIPDSVTSIGNRAFDSCYSLTSLSIPECVTSINEGAFWKCFELTSITIPKSVTSIRRSAFYSCSSLTSLTIPNCVSSIGDFAFYKCSSLTSLTIPNSVSSIGEYAFYECSSLKSISVSRSCKCPDSFSDGPIVERV